MLKSTALRVGVKNYYNKQRTTISKNYNKQINLMVESIF